MAGDPCTSGPIYDRVCCIVPYPRCMMLVYKEAHSRNKRLNRRLRLMTRAAKETRMASR